MGATLTAKHCEGLAQQCADLASLATDPDIKERLSHLAQIWTKVAEEMRSPDGLPDDGASD
jgi:hypothetical protein